MPKTIFYVFKLGQKSESLSFYPPLKPEKIGYVWARIQNPKDLAY